MVHLWQMNICFFALQDLSVFGWLFVFIIIIFFFRSLVNYSLYNSVFSIVVLTDLNCSQYVFTISFVHQRNIVRLIHKTGDHLTFNFNF